MDNNNSGFINGSGFVPNGSGFVADPKSTGLPPQNSNYFVDSLLSSSGSMSNLYCRYYPNREYREIIKRIKPQYINDPNYVKLFSQEYANLSKLSHENIVAVKEQGSDFQGPWYSMEYIEGKTLKEIIQNNEISNIDTKIEILQQILNGLLYVHRCGIIHRDLKPDNIMIANRNRNVKIIDFGLAMSDSFDQTLKLAGSKKYMSPEQQINSSNIDLQSDIYAFGLIMVEFITGRYSTSALSVPYEQYRSIASKCLKTNKLERYKNCNDIISDLNKKPSMLPQEVEKLIDEIVKDGVITDAEHSYLDVVVKKYNLDAGVVTATLNFKLEKRLPNLMQTSVPEKADPKNTASPQQQKAAAPKKKRVKWGTVIFCLILLILIPLGIWKLAKPGTSQKLENTYPAPPEQQAKSEAETLYEKALCYAYGNGTTLSPAVALKHIEQALELEPTNVRYLDAKGEIYTVLGDYKKARDLWEICNEKDPEYAKRGSKLCDYFRWAEEGRKYAEEGKTDDAIKAYQKSADMNNPWALYNIGKFYSSGRGVAQNHQTAFEYYQKAAALRLPEAEISLSECYQNGRGTPRNPQMAQYWLKQAADQGNEEAKRRINN